ncbi:hypothetical protein DITRI_Ditri01bG0108500 [Diplodiscus trichospermus]
MAVLRTLVCLAATTMLIQLAMAANITVGGANGGWDSSTDLQTWVASQKFSVGDNLIFQYTPNHDVLEVTKADYDSCQTSNPIQTYTGGNTAIPLSAPGKRYFICGTLGHCQQGMQIEIDTLATATPPATSPSTSPPPKTSPSPAESPESAPGTPSSSPDVPSTQSPGNSPPASGLSPTSPPSSANRNSFQTCLTLVFGLMLMVLFAL